MSQPEIRPEQQPRPTAYRRVRARVQATHERLHANPFTSLLTKIVVTLIGVTVIIAGIVLSGPGIPGPGFLVIIFGLAILASEWEWAERLLQWARAKFDRMRERAAAMTPAQRRRNTALTVAAVAVVAGAVALYVDSYGWPRLVTDTWDTAQQQVGFLPDLPGPKA